MGFGLEYQQPFFEDPTGAGDLLDEDEDDGWNEAYLPAAVEQSHSSRVAASTSPCSTYVSFLSSPSELVGPESLPAWTLSDSDSRISPVESPSADFAAHGESVGDRHLRTLQMSYEAVSAGAVPRRRALGPSLGSAAGVLIGPGVWLQGTRQFAVWGLLEGLVGGSSPRRPSPRGGSQGRGPVRARGPPWRPSQGDPPKRVHTRGRSGASRQVSLFKDCRRPRRAVRRTASARRPRVQARAVRFAVGGPGVGFGTCFSSPESDGGVQTSPEGDTLSSNGISFLCS